MLGLLFDSEDGNSRFLKTIGNDVRDFMENSNDDPKSYLGFLCCQCVSLMEAGMHAPISCLCAYTTSGYMCWPSPGGEVKGPLPHNATVNQPLDDDVEARDEQGSSADNQGSVVTH
jgi:hypothetical protein